MTKVVSPLADGLPKLAIPGLGFKGGTKKGTVQLSGTQSVRGRGRQKDASTVAEILRKSRRTYHC